MVKRVGRFLRTAVVRNIFRMFESGSVLLKRPQHIRAGHRWEIPLNSAISIAILIAASAAAASPATSVPIPEWARKGAFRYLRLDGGPAAAEKARLAGWPFTPEERDTLAQLYTAHHDRVLDLLGQAHINWIWLTWSVGFSWDSEAEQRRQCAAMMAACWARGIHVTAYMTGNNMFWHDMFRADRRTVNWLRRDREGLPVTYFGLSLSITPYLLAVKELQDLMPARLGGRIAVFCQLWETSLWASSRRSTF
jgi:hypothetical protein